METDIINKQYSFLNAHQHKPTLINSKHQQIISLAESVMRRLAGDKKYVEARLE